MHASRYLLIFTGIILSLPHQQALADIPPSPATPHALSEPDRMKLAREFVARISKGLAAADRDMRQKSETNADKARRLPDGEDLLLNIGLPDRIKIDSSVLGRVEQGQILLSLRDFVAALEFPIEVDGNAGTANGWYIREKKKFDLNASTKTVKTEEGTFQFSDAVSVKEDDIFVPIDEIAKWFGFKLDLSVAALEIGLQSAVPLPVQERLSRQKFQGHNYRVGPPQLPLQKEEAKAIDYPFVDVSSRYGYSKEGDGGEVRKTATSAIQTTGDFAYGTLNTQTVLEKEEKLSNIRMNYKRESLDKELLGPLKARRVEIGDVTPTLIPLRTNSSLGLGVRVTDAHPYRSTLSSSTEITGTTFPGWDVELYRGDQLISFQTVGDDGVYRFERVDLFNTDNNFRVILYGPQGEVREEEISVPVDTTRLAESGSAYDITVAAQDTQTYRKIKNDDEDRGAPSVTAMYEMPIGQSSAASVGFETSQNDGVQQYVGHSGISTTLAGTLFNLDGAVDQNGEAAAELVARRQFNSHQLRNETRVSTDQFDIDKYSKDDGIDIFSNRLNLNGPLPIGLGNAPRYNLGLTYALESDNDKRMDYSAGVSTAFSRLSVSQQLNYSVTDNIEEDTAHSLTTLSGSVGPNRLRFISNYQIKPESKLESVSATVRRNLIKDLELDLGVDHKLDPRLTEGRAQLNWKAGFADISPGVTYNTDNDLTATLNTRFGLARNPQNGKARFFDRGITSNGGISAFVFLDKNGDDIFNEGDEPLQDVVIQAPQNGGSETTDESGYAFFARLSAMRATDVYVDADSLQDPYWIPGFEGISIIPREGHITSLSFPVHMSGEIDGTVYARDALGNAQALRGIPMSLTDASGKKIKSVHSESDGFYLFEKIPPGKYLLTVDSKSFDQPMSRPRPEEITIGFDGTTLYGKNIYMEEGMPDVPVNYLADAKSLNLTEEDLQGRNIVVSMGSYKSRVMMSLMWFKARTVLGSLLSGLDLLEQPSESYPDIKTGQYNLLLVAESKDFNEVYGKCRAISAKGQPCSIQVLPVKKDDQVASKAE